MRNVDESHIDALRMQIDLLSEELADLEEEMKIMAYYGQRNMDRELFIGRILPERLTGSRQNWQNEPGTTSPWSILLKQKPFT